MSGGSYDYLFRNLDDLGRRRGDITAMAERLEKSGYAAPAEATRRVLRALDLARLIAEGLEDVWHAVEWADSGDYVEDQVRDAVERYSQPFNPVRAFAELVRDGVIMADERTAETLMQALEIDERGGP